jgi:hypothetical protein
VHADQVETVRAKREACGKGRRIVIVCGEAGRAIERKAQVSGLETRRRDDLSYKNPPFATASGAQGPLARKTGAKDGAPAKAKSRSFVVHLC